MQSRTARFGVLIAAVAVAVALFVALEGGDDSSDPDTTTGAGASTAATTKTAPQPAAPLVITIENGKPAGGVQELSVDKGERIQFTVNSDVADQVHLHGYDVSKNVEQGGSVSFDLPATKDGVFEAELEDLHEHVLELKVNP